MASNEAGGGSATDVPKFSSQRLSRMLVVFTFTYASYIGKEVSGKCLSGYTRFDPATLSLLPANSSSITTRSPVGCTATCSRDAGCRQVIYNSANGTCYLVRSPELTALAWNTADQWLFNLQNTSVDFLATFAAADNCPPPSVCISTSSSSDTILYSTDSMPFNGSLEILQVRYYFTSATGDQSDSGQVQVIYYNKMRADTAVRVQWIALTRTRYLPVGTCGRYYVTFNGAECSQPKTIDMTGYDITFNSELWTTELDGICYGVPAGNITVAINIGPCTGFTYSDFCTSFFNGMTAWIWEILPSANYDGLPCQSLSMANIQYQASSNEVAADPEAAVTTMMFNKRGTDSMLKVSWLAVTRVYVALDIPYCARWYITVNDSECTPKAEYIIRTQSGTYNYTRDNKKTRKLEGYCYGLEAGLYAITVRVGSCRNQTSLPDTNTGGYGSISRFIVSEVRASTQLQSVQTATGNVITTPFFNLKHWTWTNLNNDIDTGTILSVPYKKISNSSGLHVRLLSDMRVFNGSCRWFFTINGSECLSPGPIESGVMFNHPADYHQPGVVDGLCTGRNSGNYNISLKVSMRMASSDCYTGYEATTQLIVQETNLDSAVKCPSAKGCI